MSQRDEGHALIEVLLLGLLLLVPLVWVLTVASQLHTAVLATAAAAREAGFEAARSPDAGAADAGIRTAVAGALDDQHLEPGSARIAWAPDAAWERGAFVEIVVSYPVPVLQMPLLGEVTHPTIVVTGRHIARIDPYRSRP